MGRLSFFLWQGAALAAMASLPVVHADCFIDDNGFERCSLSNGARVGIAIAIALLALLFVAAALAMRQRRLRQSNVAYIGGASANAQNINYPGNQGNYLPQYTPAYYPGVPQYPPPAHGYDPQTGYAPPQGPPPGYYAPPQGPPPGKEPL